MSCSRCVCGIAADVTSTLKGRVSPHHTNVVAFGKKVTFVPQIRDLHCNQLKETLFLVFNKLPVTCITPGLNNFSLSELPSFMISEVPVAR